jgi:hypothetical protein
MVYFGHYDTDGTYMGFFNTEIHGSNIPTPIIELNEEQWHEALGGDYMVIDGMHTYSPNGRNIEDVLIAIRITRNLLLSECDWTQLSDSPLTEEVTLQWRVYRQSLRDMVANCDINNITYPIKPSK